MIVIPIQACTVNGKAGYSWGDDGKCYTYQPGDTEEEDRAKQLAFEQGMAIEGPEAAAQMEKKELVEIAMPLAKVDDEKQIVYGVVYEPMEEDTQGDMMTAEEIEKAAHWFMIHGQQIKKRHDKAVKARPVESYITPADIELGDEQVKKGTWVMAIKIFDDELWDAVKSGEFGGLSLGGWGKRVSLENY